MRMKHNVFLPLVFQITVQTYRLFRAVWGLVILFPVRLEGGRGSSLLIRRPEHKKHFLIQYKDKGLFIKAF